MAITQPTATTKAEHLAAAEAALAKAYRLADGNDTIDADFWLGLAAQHSILAQLKA